MRNPRKALNLRGLEQGLFQFLGDFAGNEGEMGSEVEELDGSKRPANANFP